MANDFMTPPGVLHFPHIFVARAVTAGGEPRFSAVVLWKPKFQSHPGFAKLQAAAKTCVDEKWGQKRPGNLRSPFRKGEEKEGKYQGFETGDVYISAWSKDKPGIVDANRIDILHKEMVWAGQIARLTVRPFAYDNSGNAGVAFALNAVQICMNGPRMDGRVPADKQFDDFKDETGMFAEYGEYALTDTTAGNGKQRVQESSIPWDI